MHLLLVEDDPAISHFLVKGLREEHHLVDLVEDGHAAEAQALEEDYDAIVLDLMLPGQDGFTVCRRLRAQGVDAPILVVTARHQVADKVLGLDAGADDYLVKPFAMDELLARLRALLRRAPRMAALDVGDLHLDIGRRNAFAGGKLLELTQREFDLLAFLARRTGRAVTKPELVENVWDADEIVPNVVEVHVSRLRDKLGDHAWMIETLRGVGYRLTTERAR